MQPRPPGRTARLLSIVLALGLAGMWFPQWATAQAGGHFDASANTDLVHVQALNVPDAIQLADVGVGPTTAQTSTTGVEGGGNSYARGANLDVDLLSGAIPLTGLLVEAEHRAPDGGPGPVEQELLNLPLDPLLNASVARASAHARWADAGCLPEAAPLATSESHVADLNVLTGTPLGDALVALDNAEGATVYSSSTVGLFQVPGQEGRGVRSTALTQLTGITLFKGTDNQLTIDVLAPPVVEAIATGVPGGASVTYSEPILRVVGSDGEVLGELNAASANFELDLSPLAILRLGHLQEDVSPDGTHASGRATLLEVIVLEAPGAIEPLARVTIAGGEASATAPAGGVDCPAGTGIGEPVAPPPGVTDDCGPGDPLRELHVGPSTQTAAVGSTFTYTISVSNLGLCTLSDVRVDSTIDGPPGSTIVSTDPQAESVDGLNVGWNVGTLEPNELVVLTVTVQVPVGAPVGSQYSNNVNATGTEDGDPVEQSASVTGPQVVGAPSGACDLTQTVAGASHEHVLPGQAFNLYVSLLNSGGEPCPGVVVQIPIADGIEFVGCSHNCTVDDDTITWQVGEIGPGSSLTLTATLQVPADAADGTEYTHVVTILDTQTLTREVVGPRVTGTSVLAAFPSASLVAVAASDDIGLPFTGAHIGLLVALALALLGGGEFLRRRSNAVLSR